jgi:hypothetical protein
MELIQGIEHTGQGGLIAQLALKCGNNIALVSFFLGDVHTFQAVRPGYINLTLYSNLEVSRIIERDKIPGW